MARASFLLMLACVGVIVLPVHGVIEPVPGTQATSPKKQARAAPRQVSPPHAFLRLSPILFEPLKPCSLTRNDLGLA
eukprot:1080452-Pleurochrysis_carterae.AAC.4